MLGDRGVEEVMHDGEEVGSGNLSGTAFEDYSTVTASQEGVSNTQTARSVLPGVKLPRSTDRWEEANMFFKIAYPSTVTSNITDINTFAINLQDTIYSYFAQSEGTVKRQTTKSNLDQKYKDCSIRQLKHALAKLKSQKCDGEEIMFVSRLIRYKLKPQREEKDINIESRLSENFWGTCKTLFNAAENVLPTFSSSRCYDYFKGVQSQVGKLNMFKLLSWIPTLAKLTIPFNESPPTYQEVARAVRRSKSKASPCPLDQISVIAFKKCPQTKNCTP